MQTLGPWTITGVLGQGGMGVVYRAVHQEGGPEVALKTTRNGTQEEVARIRSEIHALSGIRHPGVVRLLLDGAHEGVPWYAMELLRGRTLRDFCRELWPADGRPAVFDPADESVVHPTRRPASDGDVASSQTWSGDLLEPEALPLADVLAGVARPRATPSLRARAANGRLTEVLTLFARLCAPLAAIHARGFVHRDLKPENVFLRGGDEPVLMDLGLVAQARGAIGRERIEEGGRVLGTLAYMSPEQADGLVVDARADLYALGAMLYEALTGRRTIQRPGGMGEQLDAVRHDVPVRPSEIVHGVPGAVDDLVMSLLCKTARERIGHALDVQRMLVAGGADCVEIPDDEEAYLYRPGLRGRAELRQVLVEAVDTLKGGRGGVIVLAGESGSGKTFLATEASTAAGRRRLGVMTGECNPIEAGEDDTIDILGAPLHPFRKFLQACADRARHVGAEYAAELLGPRARILAPYEPSLAATPGYDQLPVPEPVAPGVARDRVVGALRDTLAAWVSIEGPMAFLVDDLQWTDELSFAALRAMDAEFFAATAVLFVITWRSDEVGAEHEAFARQPQVRRLQLGRLERGAVGEMVGDMLAMPTAPTELVEFVAEQTEGNPFFVAEYLRMAAAERLLVRRSGRWVMAEQSAVRRLPEPGSLTSLVERRLAGLGVAASVVLACAAVLGRHVDRQTLELTAGGSVRAGMVELERRQVLEVEESGWRFVHDKIREAAFGRVPLDQRRVLHRAAAEAMEARRGDTPDDAFEWAALARHWDGAGEPGRSARAWARAGDQAVRNFSNREARENYQKALDLAEAAQALPMERARWEAGYADACLLSGETRKGMEHEALALAHAGFALPGSAAGWGFGFLGQILLRVTQAYVLAPFRVVDGAEAERTTLAAHGSSRLLEPYFLANLPIHGCYVGLRSINLAERTGALAPLARGLGFMSMLVGATPMRGVADRWVARALALAEVDGRRENLIYVLQRTSCYDVAMGRWERALQKSRRAQQIAREIGDRRGFEESHMTIIQTLNAQGRIGEGLATALACVEASARAGDRETMAMAIVLAMDANVRAGQPDAALALYARATPEIGMHGEGIQTYFHAVAAEARLQAADLGAAKVLLQTASDLLKKTPPASYFALPTLMSGAQAALGLHAAGDTAGLAIAEQMGGHLAALARMYPYVEPARDRIAGELAQRKGRSAKGRRALEAALAAASRLAMRVEEAEAHAALAAVTSGDERASHQQEADRLFDETGARPWTEALR